MSGTKEKLYSLLQSALINLNKAKNESRDSEDESIIDYLSCGFYLGIVYQKIDDALVISFSKEIENKLKKAKTATFSAIFFARIYGNPDVMNVGSMIGATIEILSSLLEEQNISLENTEIPLQDEKFKNTPLE